MILIEETKRYRLISLEYLIHHFLLTLSTIKDNKIKFLDGGQINSTEPVVFSYCYLTFTYLI
jgi:hypothetical protein|tara:strand:- start:419 stop:604 length:186 start_codon:yes stop_codon:yes gene_type:complete